MNPPAFRDVLDGVKCVFVHVTAGDTGLGLGNGARKHPLYLAREVGAESAIHFMADQDYRPPVENTVAAVVCNGHALRRITYRNTVECAVYAVTLAGVLAFDHETVAGAPSALVGAATAARESTAGTAPTRRVAPPPGSR